MCSSSLIGSDDLGSGRWVNEAEPDVEHTSVYVSECVSGVDKSP